MSRKDYEALAAKLRHAFVWADLEASEAEREVARRAVAVVAFGVADVCASDNARFDRARFLSAAGVVEVAS